MEESIKMDKIKLITMSPLVLAYLGDTVYESYIREHLIRQNINRKVNNLHKLAIQYSKAKAQATIIHELEDELTEEEMKIFKRGRIKNLTQLQKMQILLITNMQQDLKL